ncbi:MAG: SDR family oxidoreductase [Flavobacteriia bacterium]|nr:SDR family oxidoreductase [Flavobacteriia bacterium]OJX35013.1 MAG: hypothetical protein BGO87_09770 [Flavobacteriia bacterium 40-80]
MITPFLLENKTILVTGATSGIGRCIVELIISMKGKVIATGRNSSILKELENRYSSEKVTVVSADLTKEKELIQLVESSPSIDGVVYSAGIVNSQPIRYLSRQKLEETMVINFYVPVELIGSLDRAKKINKKASFVFISSVSSLHPHKGGTSYSASKASLDAFVKVLALEYAHRGIRANSISPGMVKTPLYEQARELAGHTSMNEHLSQYPLGIGEPEDVANAVVYLLSDASRWMTGSTITLDGGLLLGY